MSIGVVPETRPVEMSWEPLRLRQEKEGGFSLKLVSFPRWWIVTRGPQAKQFGLRVKQRRLSEIWSLSGVI